MAKRHMALGKTYKLGDDTFVFKPLGTEYIPDIMELMDELIAFKDVDEKTFETNPQMIFKLFKRETVKRLVILSKETIKISYPDWSEDVTDSFVASNFFMLFFIICELNKFDTDTGIQKSKQSLNRLDGLKKRVPKNSRQGKTG